MKKPKRKKYFFLCDGALTCVNCHDPNGVLDWKSLGYPEDEIKSLTQDPLK